MPMVGLRILFAIGVFQFINSFRRTSLSCAVAFRKFSPKKRIKELDALTKHNQNIDEMSMRLYADKTKGLLTE